MEFSPDLQAIPLAAFFERIRETAVLPGQKILLEQPEARLDCLLKQGFSNVLSLQLALKTRAKIRALADRCGLSY